MLPRNVSWRILKVAFCGWICCMPLLWLMVLIGDKPMSAHEGEANQQIHADGRKGLVFGGGANMVHQLVPPGREEMREAQRKKVWYNYTADPDPEQRFSTIIKYPDFIVFNRVPKCASTTLKHLFKTVCKTNWCNMVFSTIFAYESISKKDQKLFVDDVMQQTPHPVIYERHIHFVDFRNFSLPNPVYINIVRDPLDRLVSDFYFKRNHLMAKRLSRADSRLTYDECVAQEMVECVSPFYKGYFKIIPFFCGQDPRCRNASAFSLATAKQHVITHFSLVGITEELVGFLEVLQYIFPRFFKDVVKTYLSLEDFLHNRFKTSGKIPPNNRTVELMLPRLGYDYDFYYFIKQRFYNTWKKVQQMASILKDDENI